MAKKAHTKGKTSASHRKKPVLSKGHPQDVAHPATVEKAESDPETELCVASLNGTANLEPPLTRAVTRDRAKEQTCYVEKRQGSDSGGSGRRTGLEATQRRHATSGRPGGGRHNINRLS